MTYSLIMVSPSTELARMKLNLENRQLWFTSDTHYNHANICRSTTSWIEKSNTRDFDTLEEMNSTIVNNINSLVHEDDILIHLGDWSLGGFDSIVEFRKRINCREIRIVLGNHDHHIANNKNNIQLLFSSVHDYLQLEIEKSRLVCMHYPIASWNGLANGYLHLHGHTHSRNRLTGGKSMDVGMDSNSLLPVNFRDIVETLSTMHIDNLFLEDDYHSM